jgi:transglutaminase-like putative cysteine protease
MVSLSARSLGRVAGAVAALILLAIPVRAQPDMTDPAAGDSDRNSPAHIRTFDVQLSVTPDLGSTITSTTRLKILRESAIRSLGQQSLSYLESLETLEIIEAYTEKQDGRKLPVDPANILTRDSASGLDAVYLRDAKVTTLIFPDLEVGDTIVWVSRSRQVDTYFPGYFIFDAVFPRSLPIDIYRLTIDEPNLPGLKFSLRGDGLVHESAATDTGRRHQLTFKPTGWDADEPSAISPVDRDPRLVITTFKDWSEVGASYWSKMKRRDAVDPEIQALAEVITKGIGDKRAQAAAIDYWVKKNIRYVHVLLGASGTTPNPPTAVLKNKFGDCKDHVALMGALLTAKGIASEQVLINTGNVYRQPGLAVPHFDHVMLYLPEFDVYTDPTASYSSFAMLPEGAHDKPVLHLSDVGGRPARTPAMKPEEHVTIARTTATISSDGVVKGATRQTSTGIFAAFARTMAAQIQEQGREKFAETVLRNLGQPGTGVFAPAAPFDFSEPYHVQGEFSLNQKLPTPLAGTHGIPFGIPIDWRPGLGLLGQRIERRKTEFVCYAGKQVEEIELTFAAGLPLPRAIRGTTIDHDYFKFQSSYTLDGQTLVVRREFTSNVPGQVCAREVEATLTEPMERVARSLRAQMTFGRPTPSSDSDQP